MKPRPRNLIQSVQRIVNRHGAWAWHRAPASMDELVRALAWQVSWALVLVVRVGLAS